MHGRAFRGARGRRSRTTYRPIVTPEGSTRVDAAFTGTTSPRPARSGERGNGRRRSPSGIPPGGSGQEP
ncbi:hypothetical protein EF910_26310 [Streptomyces sp. WAC07149]|nr:hypothetical protein EF910_26310 [Streptomyces sp. WAC07149]